MYQQFTPLRPLPAVHWNQLLNDHNGMVLPISWMVKHAFVVVACMMGFGNVGNAFSFVRRRSFVRTTCSFVHFPSAEDNMFKWNDKFNDVEAESSEVIPPTNVYIPRIGIESKVAYYGNNRELSLQEFMLTFQLFPGLAKATQQALWPEDRNFTESENLLSDIAIKYSTDFVSRNHQNSPKTVLNEVRNELISWRTFLDGAINKTGGIILSDRERYVTAVKFNKLARLLLETNIVDKSIFTLMSLSQNIQYSSYVKKSRRSKNLTDKSNANTNSSSLPVLTINATALWIDTLQSFFDVRIPTSNSSSSDETLSFSKQQPSVQSPVSNFTAHEIRDVLLNSLRLILSTTKSIKADKNRNMTNSVDILYPSSHKLSVIDDYRRFFPSVVMVELACMMDFGLQSDDSIEEIFDCENQIILRIIP